MLLIAVNSFHLKKQQATEFTHVPIIKVSFTSFALTTESSLIFSHYCIFVTRNFNILGLILPVSH